MRGIQISLIALLALCFSVSAAMPVFAKDKAEISKAQPALVVLADVDVKYVCVESAQESVGTVGEVDLCYPVYYKQPVTDATLTPFRSRIQIRNGLNSYSFTPNADIVHSPQIE